jgi:hypothetical protein
MEETYHPYPYPIPIVPISPPSVSSVIANSLPYTNAAILTALQSINEGVLYNKYSYKNPGDIRNALSQNNLLNLKNISPCPGNYLLGAIMKKSYNGHHAMKRVCK